jgi:hypothetical protein
MSLRLAPLALLFGTCSALATLARWRYGKSRPVRRPPTGRGAAAMASCPGCDPRLA